MSRKKRSGRQKVTLHKVASSAHSTLRTRSSIVSLRDASRKPLSKRSKSTRIKALHVLSDLRRNPNLTVTQAAKNRDISLQSIRKHLDAYLKQKRSGGRISVAKFDRERETLYIPSTKPDVLIPIHTKNSKERSVIGEWYTALKEGSRGDFTRMSAFPKRTFIDGVRLPTGAYEVQRIIEAIEGSEEPFENLYAMAGAA